MSITIDYKKEFEEAVRILFKVERNYKKTLLKIFSDYGDFDKENEEVRVIREMTSVDLERAKLNYEEAKKAYIKYYK